MEHTEKLFYAQPPVLEFTARVLECEEDKNGWQVVLDRTAFYPEGGGQPADQGLLGGVRVLDVHEKEGVIRHLTDGPLTAGETVEGRVDAARRLDLTQQHSGEHILSGILHSMFGAENVGFHIGQDYLLMDLSVPVDAEGLARAEEAANRIVWQDVETEAVWYEKEQLAHLTYRSKKELEGPVRLVTMPGADCCACCGTHVRRAGEVGIIKILSCQKFREGVRLEILCGSRAYRYLSQVYDQDRAVAQLLSVKPQDTLAAAERQAEELAAAKQRMTELEDQLFSLRAQALTDRGDLLLLEPPTRPDGARKLADAAAKASGGLAAVFAGAESSYVYALVQADRADISPLVKRLNAALSGRGGGRNGFAQGSVQADRTAICDFFRKEGIECPTC